MPADNPPTQHTDPLVQDDIAYILPLGIFMGFVWLAGKFPSHYPLIYIIKTILVAAALVMLWPHYTKIRWNQWWLGLIVGIVGIFQWIGMQLLLQKYVPFFRPAVDVFNPMTFFPSPAQRYSFIAFRWAAAVLVVPVMEELFWRDFLWRQVLAPNNFKLATVGERGWAPVLIVSLAFCSVHGNWFPTAFVWALLIAALLIYTKSLGACIIAHATTNLLLGAYVLYTHDWSFW